jgi:hypothetical protein
MSAIFVSVIPMYVLFSLCCFIAIDIVLGGPPCVDFSLVNANRQGVQGREGQYMLEFGRTIRKIERLQSPHPLLFLAENVILKGDDLEETRNAFGLDFDPITLDAMYVSPTRRKRHFVMNIPLMLDDFDFIGSASTVGPSSCLEEGFKMPGQIVENNLAAKVRTTQSVCSCFLCLLLT